MQRENIKSRAQRLDFITENRGEIMKKLLLLLFLGLASSSSSSAKAEVVEIVVPPGEVNLR